MARSISSRLRRCFNTAAAFPKSPPNASATSRRAQRISSTVIAPSFTLLTETARSASWPVVGRLGRISFDAFGAGSCRRFLAILSVSQNAVKYAASRPAVMEYDHLTSRILGLLVCSCQNRAVRGPTAESKKRHEFAARPLSAVIRSFAGVRRKGLRLRDNAQAALGQVLVRGILRRLDHPLVTYHFGRFVELTLVRRRRPYSLSRVFVPLVRVTTIPFRSVTTISHFSMPSSAKFAVVFAVVPSLMLVDVIVRALESHFPSASLANPSETN